MAAKAPFKRLVVLSDGTWQNENSPCPTNILKITKSLKSDGDDGIQTCLYYDAGVGTGGRLDSIMGGAMGAGIDANLKQLYIWLACNYDDGKDCLLPFLPFPFELNMRCAPALSVRMLCYWVSDVEDLPLSLSLYYVLQVTRVSFACCQGGWYFFLLTLSLLVSNCSCSGVLLLACPLQSTCSAFRVGATR